MCSVYHFDKAGLSAISPRGEWVTALACQTSWCVRKWWNSNILKTLSKFKCKRFEKASKIVSVHRTVEWLVSKLVMCGGAFSPPPHRPTMAFLVFHRFLGAAQRATNFARRINPTTSVTSSRPRQSSNGWTLDSCGFDERLFSSVHSCNGNFYQKPCMKLKFGWNIN